MSQPSSFAVNETLIMSDAVIIRLNWYDGNLLGTMDIVASRVFLFLSRLYFQN